MAEHHNPVLMVLLGLNLRPFLTSVGPVLDLVRGDIGLDGTERFTQMAREDSGW